MQFSNDIARHWKEGDSNAVKSKNLQNEYSDRLIVIDEVHNIRISNDNDNKSVAKNLMFLVSVKNINLRLLLLSATPMFNSYKEIVWLLNLMNKNDGRATIDISDIFDTKTGNMTVEGKEMLIRKAKQFTYNVNYIQKVVMVISVNKMFHIRKSCQRNCLTNDSVIVNNINMK